MADEYYLTEFEVFRLGNSQSPRMDHVRVPNDIETIPIGGVDHVEPGVWGISLMDQTRLNRSADMAKRRGKSLGHVWLIARGTHLPPGLVMRVDPKDPTHLLVGPAGLMPLKKFQELLLDLGARCTYLGKR